MLFIHLGGDMMVSTKDVIAILDSKMAEVCDDTRRFLQEAHRHGMVLQVESEQQKSIVITETRVFLSPISSLTLRKRAGYITDVDG